MTESLSISNRTNLVLQLTVFACGALVMMYEIIGSRIVSPFIGTSTYVWTSLIGVILASLSLGYWLGGRLADKKPDVKILATVIFLAGGAVSLTILLKNIVLEKIASAPVGLEIKSVIAAILLFALASVLLGFVTPYAVKLKMSALADSGKTVGRLYALSTIGSIVGTFAAGFFLIPFLGSVRTLYVIAGTLFILGILLASFSISKINIAVLVLFFLGLLASEINIYNLRRTRNLYDIDTEYSRVQLFELTEPKSHRKFQAMVTDPYFIQSAMFLESDELVAHYNRYYHLLRQYKPDFRQTLMIGGAGYTYPQEYLRTYPDAEIEVVELDPQMTNIAHKFFRLQDNPRLKINHEDGRVFLNRAENGKYDAVLMDAFGSLFSVPYQLTTVEAVQRVHHVLKDDGVVIFNLGSAIRGTASRFLQAEFKTYQAVFPHVFLFKVDFDHKDEQPQNLIMVACKSDCPEQPLSNDAYITELLANRYTEDFPLATNIMTDDLAPVEYYNSFAQNLIARPN